MTLYKLHNKLSCESRLSRSSCRVFRAVLFDKLDTAKMHGLDTSNVSSRVVSRRDQPSGIWALYSATSKADGDNAIKATDERSERKIRQQYKTWHAWDWLHDHSLCIRIYVTCRLEADGSGWHHGAIELTTLLFVSDAFALVCLRSIENTAVPVYASVNSNSPCPPMSPKSSCFNWCLATRL